MSASASQPPSSLLRPPGAVCLSSTDEAEVKSFLEHDAERNVYLNWRIAQGVLAHDAKHERLLGYRDPDTLEMSALLGVGANMVPAGADEAGLTELATHAGLALDVPRMIIGPETAVATLWSSYRPLVRPHVQLDTYHIYYEVRPETLDDELTLPGLRLAEEGDLHVVEEASAQMLIDDLGRRDRDENPTLFRRRVRNAIGSREVFVYVRGGFLLFKVNLGPRTSHAAQLQGVFTSRGFRDRGLGRRGCAEIARRLFAAGVPVVNLFVREDNVSARRAYEAVGFRPAGRFRMIILHPDRSRP